MTKNFWKKRTGTFENVIKIEFDTTLDNIYTTIGQMFLDNYDIFVVGKSEIWIQIPHHVAMTRKISKQLNGFDSFEKLMSDIEEKYSPKKITFFKKMIIIEPIRYLAFEDLSKETNIEQNGFFEMFRKETKERVEESYPICTCGHNAGAHGFCTPHRCTVKGCNCQGFVWK